MIINEASECTNLKSRTFLELKFFILFVLLYDCKKEIDEENNHMVVHLFFVQAIWKDSHQFLPIFGVLLWQKLNDRIFILLTMTMKWTILEKNYRLVFIWEYFINRCCFFVTYFVNLGCFSLFEIKKQIISTCSISFL